MIIIDIFIENRKEKEFLRGVKWKALNLDFKFKM
jgi:hypothetical protein